MKVQDLNVTVKNEEMSVIPIYNGMSLKTSIVWLIILTVLAVVCLVVFILQPDEKRFKKIPEQTENVEVVGRRKERSGGRMKISSYIVSFKLNDGSEKEFVVGTTASHIYNDLQEGVTGTLIYKEIENAEGTINFKSHRRFISFEKDLEYGGEVLTIAFTEKLEFLTLFYFGPFYIILIICLILNIRQQTNINRTPNQKAFVKVTRKYEKGKEKGDTEYFITFSFPSSAKKSILVGKNNSEAYDFVNKGDTGTLTYKYFNNRLISCCFKKERLF